MKRTIIAAVCTLISAPAMSGGLQLTPEQQDVWAGEEAYWQFVNAGDVESFLTLWHEDFVGWPCDAETTSDIEGLKTDAPDWIASVRAQGRKTTIAPEGVVVEDEFAVTYLSATTVWTDESGASNSAMIKLVHTWIKIEDDWKIIGGMCGPLERDSG